MSDPNLRSKVDIIEARVNGDERHRERLGAQIHEIAEKLGKIETRLRDLERDVPGRKEAYGAIGLALTIMVVLALAT
ncbi:hypothetical protein LUX29_11005 [Aureimonas altamirensis]|uniref:hypothetical protein n=1 Tax=Aureimonas altamirensis TaxID=370622 RepID=UPI001E3A34AD|nr:hypothetical protein [Aureimonas altamirensis]UHD47645.1 hypothetical protein LUX29_11005 [Aureimonas altamirensis]